MPYTFNLFSGRQAVRVYARNARNPTGYTDQMIDYAIALAMDEANRIAKPVRTLSTMTLTPNSQTLPALAANCQPEFIIQAYVTLPSNPTAIINPDIMLTAIDNLLYQQWLGTGLFPWSNYLPPQTFVNGQSVGQPIFFGFTDSAGDGLCWPIPDQAYVLNYWWYQQPTQWSAGTQGAWSSTQQYYYGDIVSVAGELYFCIGQSLNNTPPNATYWTAIGAGTATGPLSIGFNYTDEFMRQVLRYGAPSHLHAGEQENAAFAKDCHDAFMTACKQFAARASGDRGAQVLIRNAPSWGASP